MDVRCSRCGTEYDFDDALVSERGTTVKCTNCGHQFKVFPGGAGGVPERWIVRKGSGRELVYTSLRDLQRAIAQRQVGPQDLLSRGGGQPLRALAAIAELEPFFHAQGPTPGANDQVQRTLLGMSPTGGAHTEDTVRNNPLFPDAQSQAEINRTRPTPAGGIAARRPDAPVRPAPGAPPQQPRQRFEDIEPKTLPRNQAPEPQTEPDAPPVATMSSGQVAINSGAMAEPGQASGGDGMTAAFRTYQDSFSDESLPSLGRPPRKSALRWVVGLVLVGAVAFVAGTVGVRYVKQLGAGPAPTAKPQDERVKKLLAQGSEELARGDFESAKEQLDKASVLAEKDPAVLTALAHLEATRADQHWLALKILPPTNKVDRDSEEAELSRRLPRVKKAAEDASAAAPNDGPALRARIDALRLSGEVNQARDLVGSLGDVSSQPETAYVLAALDLGEASPAWPSVIDRLRTAAAADRGASRARAALVYALATSGGATAGAMDEARTELAKLSSQPGSSKLTGWLTAYVDRARGTTGPAGSSSGAPTATTLPVQPAALPAAPGAAPGGGAAAPGEAVPRGTDFRKLLEDASAAKRSGDLGRAETLYRAAEEQSPGNIEALGGLGDVAKARGDGASAAKFYESVLQQNPTYLPTLVSLADIKWSSGDHPGALMLYKRVANQADPGSAYGQRAAQRIAEAQSGASGAAAPHDVPKPSEPAAKPQEPAPKPPAGDTPNVDTSDLPGFK
jgi:predicted Zn finger-like uncharacterized protein